MNWVLIFFLTSPGGDFIDKRAVYYPTQDQCERTLKANSKPQPFEPNLYGIQIQAKVCVTKAQIGRAHV